MRIAIAEIAQETDSFSPIRTGMAEFEAYGLLRGQQILDQLPGVGPLGGFLDVVAERASVEVVPLVRAWASACGIIEQATFEALLNELLDGLRAALPLDAVFLSLHGAASAEQEDDVEGHILRRVRELVGPQVPIVCPLDHHANVTAEMVRHADALIGHETQPHDPPATGRKAARVLFNMLDGRVCPTVAWRKIPMITPQDQFLTSHGPMREWFDQARQWERQSGVLDVSPYPMQPWLDVAEGGWSVVVHTDSDQVLAERIADDMARFAWERRRDFWHSERVPTDEAVTTAMSAERGLVILSDTGDSVYGGAPGDSTILLRALLNHATASSSGDASGVEPVVLVPLVDPQALDQVAAAGTGSRLTLDVGGRLDNVFSQPVTLTATVASVSLGYTADLADRGLCELGRTAMLVSGPVRLVLLEQRSFAINHPVLYQHHGIAMDEVRAVVVKTASNFQFFAPWRQSLVRVDTAGMTQSDLTAFHWKRLPRPIDPLDDMPDELP